MANFPLSIKYALENEGGYVNDPSDSGGCTNRGVTIATLSSYRKKAVTPEDVKNLSEEETMEIYFKNYWTPMKLRFLNRNNIATALLDMGINLGTHTAICLAQDALVKCLFDVGAQGIMDETTIDSLNTIKPDLFIDAFEIMVMRRYNNIVLKNPRDMRFLHGWSKRAGRLLTLK